MFNKILVACIKVALIVVIIALGGTTAINYGLLWLSAKSDVLMVVGSFTILATIIAMVYLMKWAFYIIDNCFQQLL